MIDLIKQLIQEILIDFHPIENDKYTALKNREEEEERTEYKLYTQHDRL